MSNVLSTMGTKAYASISQSPAREASDMRRLSLAFVLLLIGAVVAHTLAWRWAEQKLESGSAAWAVSRRAEGWTVTSGSAVSGGWPLAATLTVPDLAVSGGGPDIPGGLAFGAERAVLAVSFLRPRVLTVNFGGAQHVRLGGGPDIPYRADQLRATFPLAPGWRTADVEAANLRAGLPGVDGAAGMTVALLQAHIETKPAAAQGEPAIGFTGSAEDIILPSRPSPWPLGANISSISIEGAVNGPLPRAPDLVARATGWREGGGTLEVRRIALGWGPLGLTGSATLALDERMQPMGAATVRLIDPTEALNALAANQAITPRAAVAAKAVLSLMTRQPEGGGRPELEAPLTLQKQVLSLGRIPLARLPEWVWPGAP